MRNVDYSSVKQRISSYRSYKLGISHRQVMRFVAKLDLCPNDYCKRNGLSVSRENLTISPSSSSLETILNIMLNSSHVINFYDAFAPKEPIKTNSIPSGASLIDKMNLHPCFLSILGIL